MGLAAPGSLFRPSIFVDEVHERIESGHAFQHDNKHTGIASGASDYHLIRVGMYPAHLMTLGVDAISGPFELEMTEAPTITAPGAAAAVINKRRDSPLISDTLVYEGPTFTAAGLHVEGEISGSAVVGTPQPVALGLNWMLKAMTDYLVRFTNNAVGANQYNLHLMYYEDRED